jgi:S1-C subfamily serine protease
MHIRTYCLVSLLGVLLASCVAAFGQAQSTYVLEATAALSSVRIDTPSNKFGMGVALDDGATILTCAHVVDNHSWVDVDAGEFMEKGYVLAVDTENDLAIVRLEHKARPFYPCQSRDLPDPGTYTMAAGKTKASLDIDMRAGSVITRLAGGYPNMVISTQPIPGYSGGPVMDENGYLIGIMRASCTLDGVPATEVIPAWKLVDFIQRTRKDLSK